MAKTYKKNGKNVKKRQNNSKIVKFTILLSANFIFITKFTIFVAKFMFLEMIEQYYNNIIFTTGILLLFLGGYLCFGAVPSKDIFKRYKRSRILLGAQLLWWGIQCFIIWKFDLRGTAPHIATALNLTTYYLATILFGASFISLLDNRYINRRQTITDIIKYTIFVLLVWVATLCFSNWIQNAILVVCAVFFFADTARLSLQLYRSHKRAERQVHNYYSEGVDSFIRWMSKSVYYVIFMGLFGGILAFAPKWAVTIYATSGIVMFIYIFASFQNYMTHFEEVENAMDIADKSNDDDMISDSIESSDSDNESQAKILHSDIKLTLDEWVKKGRYRQPKVTLGTIADEIGSNRTYLSQYINVQYGTTFREWVNNLRIEEAKSVILDDTEKSIALVSDDLGYSSGSQFIRLFSQQVGVTPSQWRKQNKAETLSK